MLALASLLAISCSKSDDDGTPASGSNTPPPDNTQEQYFIVKQGNDVYSEGTTTVQMIEYDGVKTLNIFSNYTSQNAMAELEFYGIPNPGNYTPDGTMGFGFSKGTDWWFCGEGCVITISEHDESAKYLKGKVSGTMTTIQGSSVNNISCEFGVEY